MEARVDTDTESAQAYEAAAKPKRGARGLTLLFLIVGALGAGGAAGAFGLLAPIYDLATGHNAAAMSAAPVFYALPEFRVVLDTISEYRPSSPVPLGRHLRAVMQLEVVADRTSQVDALQPRIVDVLLTFLHALDEHDLASIRGLHRLKAQMLHRVRQVTGDDAVRSLLITELTVL
jgi:flagellar FliL protein